MKDGFRFAQCGRDARGPSDQSNLRSNNVGSKNLDGRVPLFYKEQPFKLFTLLKMTPNKLRTFWPLLLCVAVGFSCNLSDRRSSDSNNSDSSRPAANSDESGEGSWNGTVTCDNGNQMDASYKIASSGNPVYEYQSKSGPREVELSEPGQMVRFVPPGGGVTTVVVDSISTSPERISYSLNISEESSGGGTLSQSRATMETDATIDGSNLDVEFTVRSQNVLSQPGIVVPGDESRIVCRGKLRK